MNLAEMQRTLDSTPDDALPALYADWIGCNPVDGGDETTADMRETLGDYVTECAVAYGQPIPR